METSHMDTTLQTNNAIEQVVDFPQFFVCLPQAIHVMYIKIQAPSVVLGYLRGHAEPSISMIRTWPGKRLHNHWKSPCY